MKNLKIFFLFTTTWFSYSMIAQNLEWNEIHNGVWRAKIGAEQHISLLKAAEVKPDVKALDNLSDVTFPLDKAKISAEVISGKTYLRFPLEKEEELYGLGLNFKTHNQRGRILNLHVDHYGNGDSGRTHAPVPFYVSTKGYGVLIDAANYLTVYAGTGVRVEADERPVLRNRNSDPKWEAQPYSDAVEILVPANGTEVYVFGGNSMLEVVQRYNLFSGGGYLPPKWGLGFTQRVPTLFSAKDILNEVADFEHHNFPLDFIGVEPGWQSMAYPCTFEWEKTRFPDPEKFISTLLDKGIRANLWLNPYVSPVGSLYPKVKPLSGSHTVWNGVVPDLTLDKTRHLFKEHFYKNHLDIGVSGYKIDEVDGFDQWLWPDVATFPSGTTAEEMRQVYGLLVQNMTAKWFKEMNRRTYSLVRASNAGASSFPYVIYDDYYSHKDFITALINSSFIGVLWTPEVRASKSAEEWLRRMQTVCFSPMAMLNAWADGTKPWSFPEVEAQVRDVAQLRMRLLPYMYTSFARYRFEGIPPFRAMQLLEGFVFKTEKIEGKLDGTDNPYAGHKTKEVRYQYMMGDAILVAPMFVGETSREVVLPKDKWYDFYTGAFVGEEEIITIEPGLDKIPLFVKNGSIIPMTEARNRAPKTDEKLDLTIRHYGDKEGQFTLYDDDGLSFDFENGQFSQVEIKVVRDRSGHFIGSISKPERGKPYGYNRKVAWEFMTQK
ncbi:glycoside hydrolase family 31 protein [Aestuariivivens insulae]|uniref:glycoside hydrolase family 31 protein n=1 Tax=Aestuariivivens insulae TaxID=1621988 RepID=UPI001F56CBE6|nr:TIM-barrel domain-containing protein [Aestuariivivens insulae]